MNNKPNSAQVAAELVRQQSSGSLATNSIKHPDFPYCSLMPYANDEQGRVVFLISSLAVHSKNLRSNGKASLLVSGGEGNLADARLSIIGNVSPVEEQAVPVLRDIYVSQHPEASQWASFGDFQFVELQPIDLYLVGGFGSMGWINPSDFVAAFEKA